MRIRVAIAGATSLELYPQSSKLGAGLVGDVELGDADFDRWLIVRANDVELAGRLLDFAVELAPGLE